MALLVTSSLILAKALTFPSLDFFICKMGIILCFLSGLFASTPEMVHVKESSQKHVVKLPGHSSYCLQNAQVYIPLQGQVQNLEAKGSIISHPYGQSRPPGSKGSKKMPNFWEPHIPPPSWEPKFQEMRLKLALEQLLQSTSQLFLGLESRFPC